ncbi:hypothetical protein QTH91_20390 [Variovorax dokdonensis]|uniref:Uncharacterized protein n=1 Tax=Variovorax dokdonensis TaxID=344883 RepID=A0ABT7NFX6_9BURK|nr:hypothetical protein [Variovorax dokdonensis]
MSASNSAQVQLGGRVSYDSVPSGPDGALDYESTVAKPVRGAVLEVISPDTGNLVTSSTTDDAGRYSVAVPSGAQVIVRVRAQATHAGADGQWDMSVRDNTQGDSIYSMESPAFTTGAQVPTRDLHAPSGWGKTTYDTARVAAPFAVLDAIYSATKKVLGVAPGSDFPPLRVYWSTENAPAVGLVSLGQIGTTSFTRDGNGIAAIYLLGKENVDTDEYDVSVIAHEWGHYYQSAFSRDDSPGGPHSVDDRLDMRLAFSEGWGNAWSGIATGRDRYTDSLGPAQSMATVLSLVDGGATPGWFSETSVHSVIWRLYIQYGLGPIHRAFVEGLRQTPALVTIHAFAAAFAAASPSSQSELSSALVSQGISGATNSAWAEFESNSGGISGTLPLYRAASLGVPTTACVSDAAGEPNKMGNYVYLRYAIPASRGYRASVSGPSGTDPDIGIFTRAGQIASAIGYGNTEALSANLAPGEVVLALNDANGAGANCFQVVLE